MAGYPSTTESDRPMRQLMCTLLMCGMMVSCAVSGDRHAQPVPQAVEKTPVRDVPPPQQQRLTDEQQRLADDMVFNILLGEIAGQRGDFKVSIEHYLDAARQSSDPRVAERAMQIASYAHRYDLALVAARRWVELDSSSLDAHKSLTALALQAGDMNEVVKQINYLLSVSDDPEEGFRTATAVLARMPDKQVALDATRKLVDRYPKNAYAWMSLCRIAVLADQLDAALQAVDHALSLQPHDSSALILKAQVLVRMKRNADATALLKAATTRAPDDADLAFAYGRMLLDAEDLEGARLQYERVVKLDPDYPGGLYSLALIELETHHYRSGEKHLKQVLKKQEDPNAYYYLGYAASEQGHKSAALDWYMKVESGDYWSQAQLRAAEIMAEKGQLDRMREYLREMRQKNPEKVVELYLIEGQVLTNQGLHQEAFDLYKSALQVAPDNDDLLYSYALSAEALNKLSIAEGTLRQLLVKNPDDVRSLNALGYTLADRTDRYQEALGYISKAFKRSPEDPAIIDSMGWVHFRLGDLEKARTYLKKAWDMNKDSEIGAHYGEALWASGRHDEARQIWDQSRKLDPADPVLREVLQRIKP
jgi:tetratricopeptide (TPR) repeat protein